MRLRFSVKIEPFKDGANNKILFRESNHLGFQISQHAIGMLETHLPI
jgi:hypothetical protein